MNNQATAGNRTLEGQGAIVTGGGRNIGRAIAQELARAGAKVAVLARSTNEIQETVRLIEQEGGEALAIQTDVTDGEGVERAVQEAQESPEPISGWLFWLPDATPPISNALISLPDKARL